MRDYKHARLIVVHESYILTFLMPYRVYKHTLQIHNAEWLAIRYQEMHTLSTYFKEQILKG